MKIVFMGTASFAVQPLLVLIDKGYPPQLVVTSPDRPRGRGYRLGKSPVKKLAEERGLPLFQPQTLKDEDSWNRLKELTPEIIITSAFGLYIPSRLLNLPPLGCINLHPSLLPRYRGAAPIRRALMNGETITGVTTFYMDQGWDSGDIVFQEIVPIEFEDDYLILQDKLSSAGCRLLIRTIEAIKDGNAPRIPQEEAEACYASAIKDNEGLIDWAKSAEVIYNQIRALSYEPGTYTFHRGKRIKIWKVRPVENGESAEPGEVVSVDKSRGIVVSTSFGNILITELQPEGKRRMTGIDYINGYRLRQGERFGI